MRYSIALHGRQGNVKRELAPEGLQVVFRTKDTQLQCKQAQSNAVTLLKCFR